MGAFKESSRIAGKQSLSRREKTLSEEADLPAVGMARKDQINGMILQHRRLHTPVFGMMAEQDFISVLFFK